MVGEIAKIVADALSMERALHLPAIGSLYVERRAAKMLSKRRLQRAVNVVDFTSSQRGRSLVDVLAERCVTDTATARDIYERWLAKVSDDDMLRIEGVGLLRGKSFLIDESFDALLNPMGHQVITVSRYSRYVVAWIIFAVCIVAVGGATLAGLYHTGFDDIRESITLMFSSKDDVAHDAGEESVEGAAAEMVDESVEGAEANVAEQPEIVQPDNVQTPSVDDKTAAAEQRDDVQSPATSIANVEKLADAAMSQSGVTSQSPTTAVTTQVQRMTSGRHYVVLGVYSTSENALRAVRMQHEAGYTQSEAYHYGQKFMVAIFSDDQMERCSQYAREQRRQYANLWIYTAR